MNIQSMRARSRLGLIAGELLIFSLAQIGCGGGGGGAPPAPPAAIASASTTKGTAPLSVSFDASKSTDPQSFPLTYVWTFGDGTTSTQATGSHTYQKHGNFAATVAVNDGHNTTTSGLLSVAVAAAPPTVQPTSVSLNVIGVSQSSVSAQASAADREGLALTYAVTTPPTVGTATVDASTGAITYTVPGHVTTGSDTFTVKVSNPYAAATGTVTVALNFDPLLVNQWHIQNLGHDAFSSSLPVSGNDMNVVGAWNGGYSGKGIKVGVADTGLEAAHEDLVANVDLTHSYNFLTATNDPSPSTPGFDHGTSVSGIIGAVAFNGKGGRGIAYNATLRGYNLLAPGAFSVANMATSLGSDPVSADNDLFNASFGADPVALPTFSGAYQAITVTTYTLRGGLGAAIVNAAGNDFNDFETTPGKYCAAAQHYGVSCGDPASDERRGGETPIVVGALDASGLHSSYSSAGSALWISAPGGEYGVNQSVIPAQFFAMLGDPIHGVQPAIITTARTGCQNADQAFFNQNPPVSMNPLDDQGANPLAAQCEYTAQMNGTSAATPDTSGVVALMLEANPKLSVRDIKYVLAKSAKHVDPTFAGVSASDIVPGGTVVLEQGWVTNAAGFNFSNRYGFGGVDAAAAVSAAKAYTNFLPPLLDSTGNYQFIAAAPAIVPAGSTVGGYIPFTVGETFNTVEFVVVYVNIDSTPGLLCNQIELSSPSGTKSILLHAANGFTNAAIVNSRFESNAFYGEPVNGLWTLRFLDFCAGSAIPTALSTTQPQILLLSGH
jgi:subtilisin family serine protease